MDCRDIREKLSAYMDGELEGALMKAVADHVEACEACRDEVRRMEAAWDLLDGVTVPEPSRALKDRILQNAAGPSRTGAGASLWSAFRRWPMTLAAAAAVLFGVLFGSLLGQAYETSPQTESAPQTAYAPQEESLETAVSANGGGDVFSELPEGTVGWYLADLLVTEEQSKGDEEDAK